MIFDSITSVIINKNNNKILNIFDFGLVVLYLFLLFIIVYYNNLFEELVEFGLLITRYTIQIIRTLILFKKYYY